MRILFFIDGLYAGGKERRLTELMKGLNSISEISFEIVVMNDKVHYQQVFDLNTKVHYLIRKTKKDLSVFQKFYRLCKSYRPDIVHCWDSMTAVIAVPICKLLNIILVNGMVVDTPVKQNIFNKHWFRAKLTFPFSSIIVGNSKAGLIAYGAPPRKSSCIYNGIDLNRFKNLESSDILFNEVLGGRQDSVFIVGMIAAFEPRKDHKTFLKAALTLLNSNESFRFILVGDGINFLSIKNSVPPKFSDKIIFLGKRTNIESIINLFDVGVLLTNSKVHGEGISNSIIEYMASEKPAIATRGGGTDEVIINAENGYLINSDDSNQLVQFILKLANNKKLLMQLGTKSYETIISKFDLKIMTKNYIKLYQQVYQEKNKK